MTEYISAREAVTLLGIKPATLYTYVSRGWVSRIPAPGKRRSSLYLRADIEKLKARHDARAGHAAVAASALRYGEPVIDSAITAVLDGRLYYRGSDAVQLARAGLSFEQLCELLFDGELPAARPRWPEPEEPAAAAVLRAQLRDGAGPLRAMLTALSLCRARSRRVAGEGRAPELERARGLIAYLAGGPGWAGGRAPRRHQPVAARVARALGVSGDAAAQALELALVLVADHELNTSTFAARLAASTGSDLYACLMAALATASGPLHGGATLRVEALVDEAMDARRPAAVVTDRLARGARVPGFGHPLYPDGDPRAQALLETACALGRKQSPRLRAMLQLADAMEAAGHPPPNADFGLVALTQSLRLRPYAAAFVFAVGRLGGWVAHIAEQRASSGRLRPRARYVGRLPEAGRAAST